MIIIIVYATIEMFNIYEWCNTKFLKKLIEAIHQIINVVIFWFVIIWTIILLEKSLSVILAAFTSCAPYVWWPDRCGHLKSHLFIYRSLNKIITWGVLHITEASQAVPNISRPRFSPPVSFSGFNTAKYLKVSNISDYLFVFFCCMGYWNLLNLSTLMQIRMKLDK